MITRVISGAQSGVDLAALDAALAAGLPTGGWMPKGFLAEDGFHPEYAAKYGMRQMVMPSHSYPERTRKNIAEADATLILTNKGRLTGGTALTWKVALASGKPVCMSVMEPLEGKLRTVRQWLTETQPGILNVAGPRESRCPRIYAAALAFLTELFRGLRE